MKRFYCRTNKINAAKQIAKHQQRSTRLRRAREAAAAPRIQHAHHVAFSDNDPLPPTGVFLHHHMSSSKNYPQHILHFVQNPPNDPSKNVLFSPSIIPVLLTCHLLRTSYKISKIISLDASLTKRKSNLQTCREIRFESLETASMLQKFYELTIPLMICVAIRIQ